MPVAEWELTPRLMGLPANIGLLPLADWLLDKSEVSALYSPTPGVTTVHTMCKKALRGSTKKRGRDRPKLAASAANCQQDIGLVSNSLCACKSQQMGKRVRLRVCMHVGVCVRVRACVCVRACACACACVRLRAFACASPHLSPNPHAHAKHLD